ncbi:helix-turn-helix domain-containing protein [Brevibacillus marinus]|uniref:helix-turn-helix domain-containing protein n=1 Tax=Brevibacillus marinus TaxID=2496837 RepID=UPI000F84D1AC|nr:helix-turn-helix transcriptional regulator [Brevibacillus marinus]
MIGQRIRLLRKMRNMTQADLAEALNLAKTTISSYENDINEPNHEMLIKLADFFHVSVDYLIGRTDTHEQAEVEIMLSKEQLKKIDELYEILFSIEDEEERNRIIETAIVFANGVKSVQKRNQNS